MACGIRERAVLEQVVINFQHIHQVAPHYVNVIVCNSSKLLIGSVRSDDLLGAAATG